MLISGTARDYANAKNLKTMWSLQKRGILPTEKEKTQAEQQIAQLREQAESSERAVRIEGIAGKLRAGMKISTDDLDYLKENSPELYKEAVKVLKEREAYRKELERCRTKEEVEALKQRTVNRFTGEIKAVMGSSMPLGLKQKQVDYIGMRFFGVLNEHAQFQKTKEYQQLPESDKDKKSAPGKRKGGRGAYGLTGEPVENVAMKVLQAAAKALEKASGNSPKGGGNAGGGGSSSFSLATKA